MTIREGRLAVGSTGKSLDTTVVQQTDGIDAHREAVFLADPEVLAARAAVKNDDPNFGDYGIATRPIVPQSQFGEILVVERSPVIELNGSYGTSLIRDKETVTNSGAIDLVDGEIRLRTGATASSTAFLETTEAGRYQPGYGAEGGIGVRIPTDPTGNQSLRWGLQDIAENNGFYFGADATGNFIAVKKDGTETKTYQSSWNIDPLDGTGSSGLTLDLSEGNIYQIDYTWYAYGQILWGIVDVVGNRQRFVPCHSFKPSGAPSINTPNLQLFAKADNGGDASSIDLFVGGRQFSVIGRYNPQFRFVGDGRAAVSGGTSTTAKPTVSFRHKSGFSDRSIKVDGITLKPATEDVIAEIRIGGTLTSPSWGTPTNHTAAETAVERDISASAITGGVVIWSDFFAAGQANKGITDGANLTVEIPVDQVVTLCVRTLANTGTCKSFMRLKEEW